MRFPHYNQFDQMDCGPTCLQIISKYHGKRFSIQFLRNLSNLGRSGVSLLGISRAAEKIGFRTIGAKIDLSQLNEIELPCILHWNKEHFVVLYKVKRGTYYISNPATGLERYSKKDFINHWSNLGQEDSSGIVLILSPTPLFYEEEENNNGPLKIDFFFKYLKKYRRYFFQLILSVFIGSLLMLLFPLLNQALVDVGINSKNIPFVHAILIAQIMLFLGRLTLDFLKSWIVLHISTRINISILTDFLIKLLKLPLVFFDTKNTGDILQRMGDQKRIENFLTNTSINSFFTLLNIILFSALIASYSKLFFTIILFSMTLYILWIFLFLRRRKGLDHKNFTISANNQSKMIQFIQGMQDIKLNNFGNEKRWEWEEVQVKMFNLNKKILSLTQLQQAGSFFLNESKNILITFLSAKAVVNGDLTLGAMMSNESHCGVISPSYFSINIESFSEAQKFNSCLNRKISIDKNGEIKNCPSMHRTFGNVKDTMLADVIGSEEFQFLWKVSKDQISICNVCEFRYICTDCRAFHKDEDYSEKPKKCFYDPYTASWNDDEAA